MKNILIGGAWPYANGSLHIGHIAALLPADVLARYHRAKGDKVYFVSGSDCHGTPVALRAKRNKRKPEEISDFYHKEFCDCFKKLGFSYDLYTKTSAEEHKNFVTEFHKKMYESKYIYEKETLEGYCNKCNTFLSDRFIMGKCPACGSDTRGDQCDNCGTVLETDNVVDPVCSICREKISFRKTKHLYIEISKMDKELRSYIAKHKEWRKNAIAFSNKYINEGLRDRALTRDLKWGIKVPKEGYEDKSIYIWAENVLGYLSASKVVAEERNENYEELWGENSKHYYVHGKDNIPFHTIILPALMIANGGKWHLPDKIISSEYLKLEGRKISTSRNYALWVKDLVKKYDADSLRYYFLSNGPERKDSDFSWKEYGNIHNSELVGTYGNFVNRTLVFIVKYLDGVVPSGNLDIEIEKNLEDLYERVGEFIEEGKFREAINFIFYFIRIFNKYFDKEEPWITRNSDIEKCKNSLYNCIQIIANLSVVLYPFLPFSSEKIWSWLGIKNKWEKQSVETGTALTDIQILFERIDKDVLNDETRTIRRKSY